MDTETPTITMEIKTRAANKDIQELLNHDVCDCISGTHNMYMKQAQEK